MRSIKFPVFSFDVLIHLSLNHCKFAIQFEEENEKCIVGLESVYDVPNVLAAIHLCWKVILMNHVFQFGYDLIMDASVLGYAVVINEEVSNLAIPGFSSDFPYTSHEAI